MGREEGEENRGPQLSEPPLVGDSMRLRWTITRLSGWCSPPGTAPVGTQDPPHQARGDSKTHFHSIPVSLGFSLELFLDSELMAGLHAQENEVALRTEAEAASGLPVYPGWLCPPMTPGAVEASRAPQGPDTHRVQLVSWDPGRVSLRAEGMIPAESGHVLWSWAEEVGVSLRSFSACGSTLATGRLRRGGSRPRPPSTLNCG